MRFTRKEIMQDVYLTYLHQRKFKTCLLSVQLITDLRRETAGFNALVPAVLRRGTMRHPDMESLSAALDALYGATIDYTVRKKGERQCVGFVAQCIDDAFAPGREKLLEPVTELLGELLLDPVTRNGRFMPAYVDSERQNLLDAIRSLKNDKRDWADVRLMQEMCADEPYGVLRLGDEDTVSRINHQKLYRHYQQLLTTAPVEIFYCGSADESRVETALLSALASLPRGRMARPEPIVLRHAPEEPRYVVEEMDVTQGKLSMGWRCETDDIPAMVMANLLFGGSSNAKLFMTVREQLSLCYYASSGFARSKRIMTVSSGIEVKDYDRALAEILHQLDLVRQGQWEPWELESARAAMDSALTALGDSQGAMENYCLGQNALGLDETPEELLAALREVTGERIMAAAQAARLDTVYFLKGKEETSC